MENKHWNRYQSTTHIQGEGSCVHAEDEGRMQRGYECLLSDK